MRNFGQEAYDFLEKLSFPRTSGSEAELKAAEMIMEQIRALGYEPTVEEFTVSQNVPVQAELTLTAPEKVSYTVTGMINAGETGPEGLDAEFCYPANLDEITLPKCRGKFVLLTSRPGEKDYKKLKAAGVVGFVQTNGTMIDTVEGADLDTLRFRDMYHSYGKMPAFAIRIIDAIDLLKRKPERVHFRLELAERSRTSRNLIVEVPGTEWPEQVIVVGAHFDSTEFSSGAWDNGGGVVQLLGLLADLKEHQPKRTVRVIFFGSEEIGLEGSKAYVKAHETELDSILYMINCDVGGSYLGGELMVSTAASDTEGYLYGLMCESGYSARLSSGIMSSDSIVFSDYGVPSLSLGQMPPDGANYMHTRHDNFARISADVLGEEIRFLQFLVQRMANIAVFPVPRVIPKDLRGKIIGYFGAAFCHTAKQTEFPDEPEPRRSLF